MILNKYKIKFKSFPKIKIINFFFFNKKDFVQLGTVKPYGQPTNKIVQFQSFFNKNPTEDNQKFVSMVMVNNKY